MQPGRQQPNRKPDSLTAALACACIDPGAYITISMVAVLQVGVKADDLSEPGRLA